MIHCDGSGIIPNGPSQGKNGVTGLPYFPVTPFFPWLGPFGMIPLPSQWIIQFGEPIPTDGYPVDAWQDSMLIFDLTDRVRDTIQQMLHRNLTRRGSVFS